MNAPTADHEIKHALADVVAGRDLAADRMASLVGRFMDGQATAAQIGALLTALRMKGETVGEVVGAAQAMRARMRTVASHGPALDTCGTGGDGSGTVNISTLAAFIVAGAGVTVAKHGNRALSSRSGSHDVLEALGLDAAPAPEQAERCLREAHLAFLFAPLYHAATKNVAVARRELGFRTLFNLLGPLTNPAGARHHLNGVFAADRVAFLAEAHHALGAARALVVHGEGQLDELAPRGATLVAELRDGRVRTYETRPADFGLQDSAPEGLKGGGPEDNARLLLGTLRGEPGAIRTSAIMTAGAGLFVAGRAADLREGAALATLALDDGRAMGVLETLRALTPRSEKAEARA
jgi:anthranilate phosphoribosyltransferase